MKRAGIFFTLWLLVLGVAGYFFYRQVAPRPLDKLWEVPPFGMTGVTVDSVRPFGLADLRGQPWVISFIFTRCGGPCPLITARMATLQRELPANVRIVSVTVDPKDDTPKVLQRYAKQFGAQPQRWVFLRGSKEALLKLAYDGFRVAVVEDPSAPTGFRVTHSTKIMLVDAQGMLRRYYDSNAENVVDQIKRDVEGLAKGKA